MKRRLGILLRLDRMVVPRLGRAFAHLSGWGKMARWRLRIMTALALMGSAAVLVTVVWASHTHAPPAGSGEAGRTIHVGVAQGQSIPAYVSKSRGELETMLGEGGGVPAAETYALVSLRTYLAPDRLTPVLGGVAVVEVYTRVQLSQVQTQIVRIPANRLPDDVSAGMRLVAERKNTEAEEYRTLAAKLSQVDPVEDRLRQTYLNAAQVAAAEATAYLSGCSCVYAAVVRATPAALDQIAARPEVRAVDPAPEVRRLDQAVFLAPLPEQQDIVLPAPSGSPSSYPSTAPSGGLSGSPSPTWYPSKESPSATHPSPSVSATRTIDPHR